MRTPPFAVQRIGVLKPVLVFSAVLSVANGGIVQNFAAFQNGGIDTSVVYQSGGISFSFNSDGQAFTKDGIPVNGITFGVIPYPPYQCCEPLPAMEPTTPEPPPLGPPTQPEPPSTTPEPPTTQPPTGNPQPPGQPTPTTPGESTPEPRTWALAAVAAVLLWRYQRRVFTWN